MHVSGVHPLSHSKIRNVPFTRPCKATGNDARKLHALAFVHVRGALLMHEVLYNEAAVGGEHLPRDERGAVTGQEGHCLRHILRLPEPF